MLDLNPCRRLERAVSWASRRWGLAALYRLVKKGLYSQFPAHSHSISRLFGESYSKALTPTATGGGATRPHPFLFRGVRCRYLRNLWAKRPPPTSRAPAPSANSEAALLPPDGGSSFAGAGAGAAAGGGGGAAAGGGGGAAAGGGGGAGAAFGGGGGGGAHGALATTPPACAVITPSLHSASAFAPPALASLALASATTAGSSWARAGEAASSATATIAASIINFLNLIYLLLIKSVFVSDSGRILKLRTRPPTERYRSATNLIPSLLAACRGSLVDLGVAGEDVLDVLVGRQRDLGVTRRGDRTLATILQALVEGLGVARVACQLVVHTRDRVIARLSLRGSLIELTALAFLLALLGYLAYGRYGSDG